MLRHYQCTQKPITHSPAHTTSCRLLQKAAFCIQRSLTPIFGASFRTRLLCWQAHSFWYRCLFQLYLVHYHLFCWMNFFLADVGSYSTWIYGYGTLIFDLKLFHPQHSSRRFRHNLAKGNPQSVSAIAVPILLNQILLMGSSLFTQLFQQT